MTNILDGIGLNAEIETNANGGTQSKAIGAMHLVDAKFLDAFVDDDVIGNIACFMKDNDKNNLIKAIMSLPNNSRIDSRIETLIRMSKVLQEGAEKYGVNNWRLIPQEEHINHALLHYLAFLLDDKQDDHLTHCACRLMFAYATEVSEGFYYNMHKSEISVYKNATLVGD